MDVVDEIKVFPERIAYKNEIVVNKLLRSKYIYHYTSQNGLEGIVKSHSLWFSDIKNLNDKEEIIDGIKIACDFQNDNELEGLDRNSLSERLFNIFKEDTMKRHFFVCCFSLGSDELPLWNYYTKDSNSRGYNIALNYRELLMSIIYENKDVLRDCKVTFGKVEYSSKVKEKYNRHMLGKFIQENPQLVKEISESIVQYLNLEIAEDIINQYWEKISEQCHYTDKCKLPPILSYNGIKLRFEESLYSESAVYCKRGCFSHEKEIRIVIEVPQDRIDFLKTQGVYKVIHKGMLDIPYLDLKFDSHCIQGIMLSPTLDRNVVLPELERLFYENKIDIKKFERGIGKSGIPVRY